MQDQVRKRPGVGFLLLLLVVLAIWGLSRLHVPGFHFGGPVVHSASIQN